MSIVKKKRKKGVIRQGSGASLNLVEKKNHEECLRPRNAAHQERGKRKRADRNLLVREGGEKEKVASL